MNYSSIMAYLVLSFASPKAEKVLNSLVFSQKGLVSYYHAKFHGRKTAFGEKYDKASFTAAHNTLPHNTLIEVENPANGKTVTLRINDRGPFGHSRVLDISQAAAKELDIIRKGVARLSFKVVGADGVLWENSLADSSNNLSSVLIK